MELADSSVEDCIDSSDPELVNFLLFFKEMIQGFLESMAENMPS